MRIAPFAVFAFAAVATAGCAVAQQLLGGGGSSTSTTDEGGVDASDEAATVIGAGCGIESGSGVELCQATTLCPSVVVDTTALPHCGFRIVSGSSELVCACGESVCSMGLFTTCDQAATLLMTQTEATVCTQVSEDRCVLGSAIPSGASSTSSTSSSSSSSSTSSSSGSSGSSTSSSGTSGSNPTCDHSCLQECGAGAGCASICGCQ